MKHLTLLFISLMSLSSISYAQTDKNTIEKPKTEAKQLSKDGFSILPDALWPMKHQLEIVYDHQNAKDEKDGSKKYLMGIGTATSTTLNQAKIDARAAAVQEMVNQICVNLKSIISKNGGIQEKKNVSVETVLGIVEEKCKQKMASGPILADCYKEKNGQYTVTRYCTYSNKDAQAIAISYLENELKNESEQLKTALRNSSNWK